MIEKERRGYIILVVIMVLLTTGSMLYGAHSRAVNNHKWCQIVNTIVSIKIPKPAHPLENPSRERAWRLYTEFRDLKNSLGC